MRSADLETLVLNNGGSNTNLSSVVISSMGQRRQEWLEENENH